MSRRSYQLHSIGIIKHSGHSLFPKGPRQIHAKKLNRIKNATLLLRKEVIQPQIPLRLPCYEFVLIADFTMGPPKGGTSGDLSFADVTGSVYKTRERIHRRIADRRLLAIPTS